MFWNAVHGDVPVVVTAPMIGLRAAPCGTGPRQDVIDFGSAIIIYIPIREKEHPMVALKLRAVGTSTGVVLPKEMLIRLRAEKGETIYAIETPTGYALTTLDPEVKAQIEAGETFMDRYRDTFAALAK